MKWTVRAIDKLCLVEAREDEVQWEIANLIQDIKACLQSFVVWDFKHVYCSENCWNILILI